LLRRNRLLPFILINQPYHMMTNIHLASRLAALAFLLLFAVSCVEEEVGAVAPRADLIFTVVDEAGDPVSGAKVFLFGTEAAYDAYRTTDNPTGDPTMEPGLDLEDVSTTSATGEARFNERRLEGSSSASGDTYVYQPRPIYFRVLAEVGGAFVNNDGDTRTDRRIGFPELNAGELVVEEIEVILR
jgi:hypothetical protein